MPLLNRRTFLQTTLTGLSIGLLSNCRSEDNPIPTLRFAVASDGHLGEPNTPGDQYFTDLVAALKAAHQATPLHFVVVNGDLVHEGIAGLLPKAKAYLDELPVPYFVTRGNHDRVSLTTWQTLWGYPTNHVVERPDSTLILLDTSNEHGDYLCGDAVWLRQTLKAARATQPVFLFMHIPFIHNALGTDICGDIVQVLADQPIVKAVFHGHDHTKDIGLIYQNTALLFDAHFGSSWGTGYRGYRIVESRSGGYSTYQYDFVNQKKINDLSF